MTSSSPDTPSGLTVDGVAVPADIEAAGPDAIAAHLAGAPAPASVPSVPESAENPPTDDEGVES